MNREINNYTVMIKIKLIIIGDDYPLNTDVLANWKSKIFTIDKEIDREPDKSNLPTYQVFTTPKEFIEAKYDCDFKIIIVKRPLTRNFFTTRESGDLMVISIHELENLYLIKGVSIEMYILRLLYSFSFIYKAFHTFPEYRPPFMHENTTGCLFDISSQKKDINRFFIQPEIDIKAKSELANFQFPDNFISICEKEIKKLKIKNEFYLRKRIKENFLLSILVAIISTIALSIAANYLYDLFIKK